MLNKIFNDYSFIENIIYRSIVQSNRLNSAIKCTLTIVKRIYFIIKEIYILSIILSHTFILELQIF